MLSSIDFSQKRGILKIDTPAITKKFATEV